MRNRFETLLAPPSLSPKELAIHLRMHPEIPKEISGACRTELVNVRTRLHDELTTVRFGREPAEEPPEYRRLCRAVTDSGGEPIPFRFFALPYADSAERLTGLVTTEDRLEEILGSTDPWLVQAWAAQALRIGIDAETTDPDTAPRAWTVALQLYTEFFARAEVSLSHTYRFLTDDTARGVCSAAWDSFIADELSALHARVDEYGAQQQGESVVCALSILALPEAAPHVSAEDGDPVEVFVRGVQAAPSLAEADRLFRQCPEPVRARDGRGALPRALLTAMTAEAGTVVQGFGDIALIHSCAAGLGDRMDPEVAGGLHRAKLTEFYDACAQVVRDTLSGEAEEASRRRAADLLQVVPADWVIGRELTKQTEIHRDEAGEMLLMSVDGKILESRLQALMDAPLGSQAEEDALVDVITFMDENPILAAGPQTTEVVGQALAVIFGNSVRLAARSTDGRGTRMATLIAGALPADEAVEVNGVSATPAEHLDRLHAQEPDESGPETEFVRLLKRLAEEPLGSAAEADAVLALVAFGRQHPTYVGDGEPHEAITDALAMTFKGAAHVYLRDGLGARTSFRVMQSIADYLPPITSVDLGDGESARLPLQFLRVRGRAAISAAMRATIGGDDERRAVDELADVLAAGIDFQADGTAFRSKALDVLAAVALANRRSSSGSAGTIARAESTLTSCGRTVETSIGPAPTPAASGASKKGVATAAAVFGILFWIAVLVGAPVGLWIWTGGLGWSMAAQLGTLIGYLALASLFMWRLAKRTR